MTEKIREQGTVLRQSTLAPGIFSMEIATGAASFARPGQFISLYSDDPSHILPRPISLCQIDRDGSRFGNGQPALRIVYRTVGAGTKEFSRKKSGDRIGLFGPLGNGFEDRPKAEKVLLVGGGIGIPPMVALAEALEKNGFSKDQMISCMGYRDRALFLDSELERCSRFYPATEDGSVGTKGTVLDAIREQSLTADMMFACGPKPMLRALKEYAASLDLPLYISMEERMACGIGACLGCVCKTVDTDEHSRVKNTRVCADGPVFDARRIDLDA